MKERHIVSARKYRPSTFSSMVGQEHLTRTLRNAIDSDRLAQAYLFCGPRGVGKTSCARIFAKTINCSHRNADGEACGECESCRDFDSGNSYNVIELDAASNNGVDNIRSLNEQVNVPPQIGRYRVFIIDEVHMLSTQAFNAFLKTLEEPPAYAVFILATTEKNKVIPTILSRCQIYDFKRITVPDIVAHLQNVAASEGIETEEQALDVIARKSDGAMRDALSIFDQVSAASGRNITYSATIENLNVLDSDYYFRFADAFQRGDVQSVLTLFGEVIDKGFDAHFFINGLAAHVRNLMVAASASTLPLLDASRSVSEKYAEQSSAFSSTWYYKALELLAQCDLDYRNSSSKRLLVELLLIRLCRIGKTEEAPAVVSAPSQKAETPPAQQPKIPEPAPEPKTTVSEAATPKPAPRVQPVSPPSAPKINVSPVSHNQVRPKVGIKTGISLPLRGIKKDADAEEEASAGEPRGERTGKYTDDMLRQGWVDYIASHPEQHIVVNAMRANMPQRTEGDTFSLRVANPAQKAEMENHLQEISGFMRDALGNDMFRLRVEVAELSEEEKPLSSPQQLARWIKDNPGLGELLTSIDAELI